MERDRPFQVRTRGNRQRRKSRVPEDCTQAVSFKFTLESGVRPDQNRKQTLMCARDSLRSSGISRHGGQSKPGADASRKGGWYGWKPSSSSSCSIRAVRAYPPIDIRQSSLSSDSRQRYLSQQYPPPLLSIMHTSVWFLLLFSICIITVIIICSGSSSSSRNRSIHAHSAQVSGAVRPSAAPRPFSPQARKPAGIIVYYIVSCYLMLYCIILN